jgi:ElaA protein
MRMPVSIRWVCKKFPELSPDELYRIVQLRIAVFVVEQNCAFQDADNKDQAAWHCMGWDAGNLIAYSRILPAGVSFAEVSIGRIVTSPSIRGSGVGKELMQESIARAHEFFGHVPIRIGAQFYLKRFYESFVFVRAGEIYLEDGIEHIEMVRK